MGARGCASTTPCVPSFFASIAEELIRPAGITTLFVVVMGLLACDKSTWIRVQNGTTYDFDEVVVATPGARHAFSKLSAGASTDYRDFDETYRYAYVSLTRILR
jgi:hypothetical protein